MTVADTGIGIDAETQARLFQPFTQANRSLDRSHGGLGLGLALVKGMVELQGGEVRAHSDGPGKGASFTLALPLARQRAEGCATAGSRDVAGPGRKVLVIDDLHDSADSLADLLALSGHRVEVAYDGQSGVTKALAFQPEFVFCDVGLPGSMDGYAVASALRREFASHPAYLVALTGYAQPDDQRRALESGFDFHLAKPVDFTALEQLLDWKEWKPVPV